MALVFLSFDPLPDGFGVPGVIRKDLDHLRSFGLDQERFGQGQIFGGVLNIVRVEDADINVFSEMLRFDDSPADIQRPASALGTKIQSCRHLAHNAPFQSIDHVSVHNVVSSGVSIRGQRIDLIVLTDISYDDPAL